MSAFGSELSGLVESSGVASATVQRASEPEAGLGSIPCLDLDSVESMSRVRRFFAWTGFADPKAKRRAAPDIEALLDRLSTGGWSIRRDTARMLAVLCEAVRPRLVLEFGSGVSTVLFAALCRALGGDRRVVSLEELPECVERTRGLLQKFDLADRAVVVPAPVVEGEIDDWRGWLYAPDRDEIAAALAGDAADLIFIDGPSSRAEGREDCRFGTLPLARSWAGERCPFAADDSLRSRDFDIVRRWRDLDLAEVRGIVPVGRGLAVGRLRAAGRAA